MNSAEPLLLSIRGLTVAYSDRRRPGGTVTAVRNASLDIARGAIVALVGESGSGKTSLAHAVLRLQPAAAGEVLLDGRNLLAMGRSELKEARRRIQPVFQDPLAALSPRRSILQTLREPLDHFSVGSLQEREELAAKALQSVGMAADMLQRYPHELSGGQRQRVALARALAAGPDLVVADEPVSALDLPLQARITAQILELRERLGIAFLFVSHDLSVVRRIADSVAVMYGGRIVESGPTSQVLQNPAHPYTQALLRAIPIADPAQPAPVVLGGDPASPLTPTAGCVFHSRCAESMPECAVREPRLRAIRTGQTQADTQQVRCHLWDQ